MTGSAFFRRSADSSAQPSERLLAKVAADHADDEMVTPWFTWETWSGLAGLPVPDVVAAAEQLNAAGLLGLLDRSAGGSAFVLAMPMD